VLSPFHNRCIISDDGKHRMVLKYTVQEKKKKNHNDEFVTVLVGSYTFCRGIGLETGEENALIKVFLTLYISPIDGSTPR